MTQAPPEPHAGRTTLEVATSARAVQLAIRARLMRDVATLWPALDAKRLDETWLGWLRAMTLLVRNYHGQSAQAAAAAYRSAREIATQSPAPRSLIKLAPEPDPEWLRKAFGYSGPAMLKWDTAKPNTALSTTLGTASRIALDGGRTTMMQTSDADPVAKGYYWVTDGDPCGWCALLAARGVVYGESSFDKATPRFAEPDHPVARIAGEIPSRAHNKCGCGLAPAFSRNATLPGISQEAARFYSDNVLDLPYKERVGAFVTAWENRSRSGSAA